MIGTLLKSENVTFCGMIRVSHVKKMAYRKEFQLISKPINLALSEESETVKFNSNSDIDDIQYVYEG